MTTITMSYDLHLFRPAPGTELLETARASSGEDAEELNPGPVVPEKEQQKRQNAALLQIANSQLEIFPFDYRAIARSLGCSEAEAKIRFRHLELNSPEDGNGIQITLADDTVSITVPYCHHGDGAEPVLKEVWKYLQVLERWAGFRSYDPQLDKVLDLERDLAAALAQYRSVADRLPAVAAERLEQFQLPPERPWWKFW